MVEVRLNADRPREEPRGRFERGRRQDVSRLEHRGNPIHIRHPIITCTSLKNTPRDPTMSLANDEQHPTSIASLLRSVGGWVAPSGRGIFMFNMLTSNMASAALGGVTTAYLTAWVGPLAAVGFTIGSCIGFVSSAIFYWRSAQALAMKAFDDFPELMMLHLIRNYRTQGFDKIPIKTSKDRLAFRSRLQNELSLRCLLMAAWHTAAPAIEEVSSRREAALVDRLTSVEED
ncbi:hypothetical protein BDY17DRAFT_298913 [Neohortaea acidophila]|uniref:Uncharacterized protein n=1 Tax=Neohortaea acidophila TaxID=245834 RepID=A0A6A6PRZ6_9PEZI|nr:uncharacterized protein BDY17DRAFT_298913 [Neohortaea acidophila]KAF2482655.1 hypothetical protein BDY17DRAFT_298913 [Neohortaea acidophila]